jgi:imidazolonepropionase-like amidohydrolase
MQRIYLADVDLLDGQGPIQHGQTIVLEGDCVLAVGSADAVPQPRADDDIRTLTGSVVMPGMVSGHFHSPFHNVGAEMGVPLLAQPPASRAYRALANAQTALACGFTTVVSAGCNDAIDAQLEKAIEEGLFTGPRMVPCGRDTLSSADLVMPWWIDNRGEWGIARCDGPDEMRKTVREEINRGARTIKLTVSGGHALPLRKGTRVFGDVEIRAAVEAAHDLGARVRTHVAGKEAILACISCGVDILDHCDDMDEECIEAMLKADVFVLPSLYQTSKLLATNMEFFGIPRKDLQAEFDHMLAILPKAAQAGVKLCVGDDYGTSMIAHGEYARELSLYVERAGIDSLEVLRWATRNGGGLAAIKDLGTLGTGKLADLIILSGDPSRDISLLESKTNILGIISRGKFVKEPAGNVSATSSDRSHSSVFGAASRNRDQLTPA